MTDYVPPSGQRTYESNLRPCRACAMRGGKHEPLCPVGFPRRYYSEAEQRKHRQLGTPLHAPFLSDTDACPVHDITPWHECGPCFEFSDRDEYDPMEAGL